MRPRQQLTELFSTFLQFESDHADRWISDARLRRQMQQLTQNAVTPSAINSEIITSEKFWSLYWFKQWQTAANRPNLSPELHLASYLQEPCYWAAQQTMRKFSDSQYRLPDCFQIAVAEVPAVLKGFNPDRGASLRTYAGIAFSSLLRDALRQRRVVDLSSDWALLRRVSKKRLLEALSHAGVSDSARLPYRLAWTCFNALYLPNGGTKPDADFWQSVAQLYNSERPAGSSPVDEATLERWLTQMSSWVRAFLYPAVGSLNTPKFGKSGEETTEVQDMLADPKADSLLDELIAVEETNERSQQQAQLGQTLSHALSQLDAESQQILRLYYQQHQTQQQIMQQMAMSQASVSRRLSKSRQTLLTTLIKCSAQWSLNIAVTPSLIKEMSAALDEWLNAHYQLDLAAPTPS